MKTVRQRLQSRIAMRSNTLHDLEISRSWLKAYIKNHRMIVSMRRSKQELKEVEEHLKVISADQKLDKELYDMVIEHDRRKERNGWYVWQVDTGSQWGIPT